MPRPMPPAPIKSEAGSTAGMIFGFVLAICVCIVLIMLTIKLGIVLFG